MTGGYNVSLLDKLKPVLGKVLHAHTALPMVK